MEKRCGLYSIFITLMSILSCTHGQNCGNTNLDIQSITERSVKLEWPENGDTPYTINIVPQACDETEPDVYYGCHCEEDGELSLTEETGETSLEIDKLFPGRQYEFIIQDNNNTEIARGCAHTVPRQPTVFQFDELITANPKVNAIGVDVEIPVVLDDTQCDPETNTIMSNRFEWFANGSISNGVETESPDEDGHFRFWIEGFEAGSEFILSIRTTSGSMSSNESVYGENGLFKTAVHTVDNVYLADRPTGGGTMIPNVNWDEVVGPFEAYLITANTTVPSDNNYVYYETERLRERHALDELIPGYEYDVFVENYYPGYKQQDPPGYDTAKIKPDAPSGVLFESSEDSVKVSWTSPTSYKFASYVISYNISVKGTPCDSSLHCSCICDPYGDNTYLTANTEYTVPSLFSGREYTIEVRTVTEGPIASDPADGDTIVYTIPRPPFEVKGSDTGTTNTSIHIEIVMSNQCDEATGVEAYQWYAKDRDGNTLMNDSLACDEIRSTTIVTADNLEPGEEYETCVSIISGDIKSSETCSGYIKTKINAPIITTQLGDDNTTIIVSWNTVSGEIYGYELLCETSQGDNRTGDTLDQDATSGKCENVTPGALYTVTVNSLKQGYEQYDDNLQNSATMRPYPVKPDFTLEIIDTSNINITWKMTGYLDLIKYQIDGGTEVEVDASHGHIIINETLQPNGMYDISLWGVAGKNGENDLQAATQKDLQNFQMYSAEVDAMAINIENETIMEISWDNPLDNADGTGLNHYIVQLWNFEECERTIIMNNADLPHVDNIEGVCGSRANDSFSETDYPIMLTVYDIEPCTNYTVIVIPVNTVGNGDESSELAVTEIIGPAEPVTISVDTATSTEINVLWNKPEPLNCPMSSRVNLTYIICENGSSVSKEQTLEDKYEYPFTGLQPFTDHEIIVEVFNSAGSKESYRVVKTQSAEPGQPQNLKYDNISHESATINWTPVDKCEKNGDIVGYSLEVCSRDKLGLHTEIKCVEDDIPDIEDDIPDIMTYEITGLFPYYNHTCKLRTRNEDFDGSPVLTSFDTNMHVPDIPNVHAVADCKANTFEITIKPNRLNGPLKEYLVEVSKENGQDMVSWDCDISNCDKYGDPYLELVVTHDRFNSEINLQQDDVYQIECTIKNTDFETKTITLLTPIDGCDGSGADVGLIVGLTFMGIIIIIIVVGLIYARMKRIGPFRESDDGFSYLEGESMEAVSVGNGNTSNNHAVAGTANAAFSREDDIEVVESSRPIQIDQFEAYCNDSYEDSRYQMAEQFGVIKKQSPVYEGIECRRPENKPKNRYTNILPFDWSLVKLKTRVGVPYSEYINATYIPGERGKDEYIATQGPVTETVDDFWRMVWEQDTPIVIMLTVFVQNNKAKCVMYWPEAGSTMVCGDILVTTKSSDSWGFDDQYRTREIHLKCNDQVRVITQYQMVEWPDYGCPDSPDELLDLVETVRQQCPDDRMTRLVVHCSAGVGRTGTYIAVDRLRQQLDNKEPTDTIDIQAMISEMREYRPHMVQTEAQYTYIHDCVNAMLLRKHGQNVDNGEVDIYENTDYPRKVSAESTESDQPTMSDAMPYPIKVSADSTDSDKPTMSGTMSMSVIV